MTLRGAVLLVAILNGAYFAVELLAARATGSVSLLADSVDFLEDTSLSLLVFVSATWPLARRARMGRVLAVLLVVPAATAVWMLIARVLDPQAPEPVGFGAAAIGALAVNVLCAAILVRHRASRGSLSRAAWLSARNDALVNLAMLAAAAITLATASPWPDVVLGAGIVALNAGAAVEVWRAAGRERLGIDEVEP